MKFAIDLSKGILGEADSIEVWTDTLNYIPDSVLLVPDVRILSVACGHCTEAIIIAKRMLALGISKKQVQQSIWVLDKYRQFTNQATVKYGFINVVTEDFLKWNTNMIFDVIVENPPFQKPKSDNRLGSRGDTSLWDKFVVKSLDLLKPGGYFACIHPTSWRKPEDRNGFWKLLTQDNQMERLIMSSGKKEQDWFGIGVRVDAYILQKTPKYKNTIVSDHENQTYDLDLAKFDWLPNYAIPEITAILGKDCEVVYNTFYHTQKEHLDTPNNKFKYPVVHTINKDGLGIKYFDKPPSDNNVHFGKPKVLLNQNELQYPYNDYKGEYGMSQLTFGIAISTKEEGDEIIAFLNSEAGKRLIAATKWNTFYTDYGMFKSFKKDWYK